MTKKLSNSAAGFNGGGLAKRLGRPSSFTSTMADEICRRIAHGKTLRAICIGEAMPSRNTVVRWLKENPEFRDQYAQARQDQADALFDEALDIARSATNQDAYAKRLLVDTIKWAAAKLSPRVYGKVEENTGDAPDDYIPLAERLKAYDAQPLLIEVVRPNGHQTTIENHERRIGLTR
jgi:hypothetical protein